MKLRLTLAIGLLGLTFGCAHAPVTETGSPRELLAETCGIGHDVTAVKGSTWLKAKSRDASGQFPALVTAKAPRDLNLEVTNLFGGTEATISVRGPHYQIKVPHHQEKNEEGYGSWGGIPLEWSTDLFLGRVPCPNVETLRDQDLSTQNEDLIIQAPASLGREPERFVFHYRRWEGRPWPESLHWERQGTYPLSVDFSFDDPEEHTRSPRKWEAKSSLGEVKMRWKDRAVTR